MSEAAVYWKVYASVPVDGIDLLAEAGGIPVQGILCSGAGDLAAMHSTPINGDASETLAAVAGQYFPIRANKLLAATTALPLVVFWGYGNGVVTTPGSGGGGGGDASAANQTTQIAAEQAIQAAVEAISANIPETVATNSTLSQVYANIDTTNSKLETIHTDTTAISGFTAQLPDIRTAIDAINGKVVDKYEVSPGVFATPVIVAGGEVSAQQSGPWDVSVNNLTSGLATESTLQSVNSHVDSIDQKVATANNQTTQITYLTSINTQVQRIPADPSTETKQDAANALLDSIELQTRIGAGWFAKRMHKLLLSDMTGSGIDLTAITPVGRKVVAVMASRTTSNGQVIYLEAEENDAAVAVDLNFGLGSIWYGVWRKIGTSTTNGCFPLWVVFS